MAFTLPQAGELIHDLVVEQTEVVRQGDGTAPRVPVVHVPYAIRGKVKPLRGEELVQARALAANVTHEVTIPYLRGLNPQDYRFRFEGTRVFDILAVLDHEERHVMMIVSCGETVSRGEDI